ncbi:MAG TPA: DUF4097 family beta strand repeat-containing protein [Candidatus Nitrosotalea sp.]|nr:DUF4097 family beta strand repeat-containing protein [Candidatus Nitrosotalea sp.]
MAEVAFARRGTLASLVLLAVTACTGDFGERVREDVHQTIAAGAAPSVRVENVAGSVRIEGSPRADIDVTATKYGHDADELRNIAIDMRREESGVAIVTSYTGSGHAGGVRYHILLPAGASLVVTNVAGTVDVSGVRGNVDVETQAGAIGVDAGTVAGARSIDLRATTGAVTLWIAPNSSARVDASSTVGAFGSDIPGIAQQRENLVGARGSGTIGSGSALIRLSTTTGAIALRERS